MHNQRSVAVISACWAKLRGDLQAHVSRHMTISNHYGPHVVAFVDILGFAQLVERMDHNPPLIDEIYTVLSRVGEEDVSWSFGAYTKEDSGSAKLTVASDSILFSISIREWCAGGRTQAWACLAAVESVFGLQRYLLKRGILTRGGIVLGSLLHHGNVIFGPGLVHAYRLESQLALYPRVIVDSAVIEQIKGTAGFQFPFRLEALITRDTDGLPFIDYLHYDAMGMEDGELLTELFRDIRQHVQAALLAGRGDPRVFQKVAWLASYFNRSLSRWLEMPHYRSVFDQITPIDIA